MHSEADIRSIDNCITVLQEGLHQPGTPAIVLKLAASWQKLKDSLCPPSTVVQLPQGEEELVTLSDNEGTVAAVFEVPKMNEHTETQVAADSNLETKSQEVVLESLGVQSSESKGQEISSEPLEVQSSADPESLSGARGDLVAGGDDQEYQRVEFPVLFYHKTTGYYYDPSTQQYLAPSNSYYQDGSGLQAQQPHSVEGGGGQEADPSVAASTQDYPSDTTVPQVKVQAAAAAPSISDMLAAASERVVERLGYEYNEGLDMYYDGNSGLYYHQESKLYYDADLGCYYEYDYENRKYSLHSRVQLPEQEKEKTRKFRRRSSSPEYIDSPEEGELRLPHIPHGSPPPEEEWEPCIRAVVSESEKLPRGTLFIITQDGAFIGREPTGRGCLITIPELKVSKLHAAITYDRHEGSFLVEDLGSVNGTYLNRDQRLSEAREASQTPCPLVHGHTLTMGSTTLTLHIHSGWDSCVWCDPSRGAFQNQRSEEEAGEENQEELDMQRRKELNRIKKKYGLRAKDTYGDQVTLKDGYSDRSEIRRKTVGSDIPESQNAPIESSSVHNPIAETNKGHQLMQKLGWKQGDSLGKEGRKGIKEPEAMNSDHNMWNGLFSEKQGLCVIVQQHVRLGREGLGSDIPPCSLDSAGGNSSSKKSQLLTKRYKDVLDREKAKRQRLAK